MNATNIRIYPETKKEMERLMEQKIKEDGIFRPYTRGEFIEFLILEYKKSKGS